jgi:hypothetical protein
LQGERISNAPLNRRCSIQAVSVGFAAEGLKKIAKALRCKALANQRREGAGGQAN